MDSKKLKERLKIIIIILAIAIMIMYEASLYLMMISAFGGLKNACWFRYSRDTAGALISNVLTTSKTVNVVASGNYKTINVTTASGATQIIPDPSSYGKWVNAGAISGEDFTLNLSGEVSLCKSYLPNFDLQTGSATTSSLKIEIPRTEDNQFLAIRFPANANSWRNAFEIFGGDSISILVGPAFNTGNNTNISAVTMKDSITGNNTSPANCSTSVNSNLDPICGRFTPYINTKYVSSCEAYTNYVCPTTTRCCYDDGALIYDCGSYSRCSVTQSGTGPSTRCNTHKPSWSGACGCESTGPTPITSYRPVSSNAPLSYSLTSPFRTFSYSWNVSDYLLDYNTETCGSVSSAATLITYNTTITNRVAGYKFWLEEGMGLVYTKTDLTTSAPPFINTNLTNYPALRSSATISAPDMGQSGATAPGKLIYTESVPDQSNPQLLRLAYINKTSRLENTGGYVLYLSHTKCKRKNGAFKNDVFTDRGQVLYSLVPDQYDLNQLSAAEIDAGWPSGYLDLRGGNSINFVVPLDAVMRYGGGLNMWLKIKNAPEDYKDSKGQYAVKFQTKQQVGLFTTKVLMPIFNKVDNVLESIGSSLFKNLTCYNQASKAKCFNFFLYIKSLLTLYVMFFGFMFLMGKTQLNQKEFITRVIKILIVGGLMNGSTFDFCSRYIFPMVMNFSNQIVANFGGYSNAAPFTFLDEILSKILLNELTLFQILSLVSFGLNGVVMFLLVLFGVMIFIIGAFQSIATYILAKMMLAFLIGTAPLFFTFMLFSQTQQFFKKWVNNLFRYTIEPAVVILGIAIFSKLFSTYFDNVLSFSVCFKCAIPFMIPNLFAYLLPSFPGIFEDIYLFCLFWFGPWGIDTRVGLMGLSIPDIVGMTIMGYMCYTYPSLASNIVSSLTDTQGGFDAGSTGMAAGNQMASATASAIKMGGKLAIGGGKKIGGAIKSLGGGEPEGGGRDDKGRTSSTKSSPPTVGQSASAPPSDQGKMTWTENPMRQSAQNKSSSNQPSGASSEKAPPPPPTAQEQRHMNHMKQYKSSKAPSKASLSKSGAGTTGQAGAGTTPSSGTSPNVPNPSQNASSSRASRKVSFAPTKARSTQSSPQGGSSNSTSSSGGGGASSSGSGAGDK